MTTAKNSFWFWHFMMQSLFLHRFHSASTEWSGFFPSLDVKFLLSGPNVLGCRKLLASVGRQDVQGETLGISSFVAMRGVTNGLYLSVLSIVLQWKARGLAGLPGLTAQPPVGVGTTSARGPAPTQLRPAGRTSALGCTPRRPSATRTPAKVAAPHPRPSWLPGWWEQGTAAKCLKNRSETPPVTSFLVIYFMSVEPGDKETSQYQLQWNPFLFACSLALAQAFWCWSSKILLMVNRFQVTEKAGTWFFNVEVDLTNKRSHEAAICTAAEGQSFLFVSQTTDQHVLQLRG